MEEEVEALTPQAHAPSVAGEAVWIVNPIAGVRGSDYERRLRQALPDAVVRHTTGVHHATELAREAVRDGARTIAVVGGDGTLAEAANGVLDENPAGDVVLGFVPAGTCNDYARGREVNSDPRALLDPRRATRVDIGRITCTGPNGPESRWFLCSCTIGIVSVMAASFTRKTRVNLAVKRVSVGLAQALFGVGELARWRPVGMRISADDDRFEGDVTNLAVMKVPYFAGGRTFGPTSLLADDGMLQAIAVKPSGRIGVAHLMSKAFQGKVTSDDLAWDRFASGIRVETDRPLPIEVDGEIAGTTPAEFSVHRRRLLTVT